MSEAYIGEIRCFGFNFAPVNWALCNGQQLPISQYQALFTILGTTYGGNGTSTFALPNLQGQIPMHWGSAPGLPTTVIGQAQGEAQVTLIGSQLPGHTHTAHAVVAGAATEETAVPNTSTYLSESHPPNHAYNTAPPSVTAQFSPKAISPAGNNQPHDNMSPYLTLNFCISLYGIFPPRD